MAGKGWTEERRKKQAEAIRKWKPWEKSTGPKTPEGKARCSRNALQGDVQARREALALCRLNREFLQRVRNFDLRASMKYEK